VNDLSFFDYGIVCFSLTLLGLLLTVFEFRNMSTRSNPVARTSRASPLHPGDGTVAISGWR